MIFLGMLIGMGPIFLGFILFEYTRKFAHKWLRAILFYALNPIMLLALMSIFSVLYFSFLHGLFNFGICLECIQGIPIPIFGGEFCILANYTPWVVSGDVMARSYTDAVSAISLLIIASAMNKLPDLSYKFAIRLSGADSLSDTSSSMSSGLGASEDQVDPFSQDKDGNNIKAKAIKNITGYNSYDKTRTSIKNAKER